MLFTSLTPYVSLSALSRRPCYLALFSALKAHCSHRLLRVAVLIPFVYTRLYNGVTGAYARQDLINNNQFGKECLLDDFLIDGTRLVCIGRTNQLG